MDTYRVHLDMSAEIHDCPTVDSEMKKFKRRYPTCTAYLQQQLASLRTSCGFRDDPHQPARLVEQAGGIATHLGINVIVQGPHDGRHEDWVDVLAVLEELYPRDLGFSTGAEAV